MGISKKRIIQRGDVYGCWTVLRKSRIDNNRRRTYLCECVCGNRKSVPNNQLISNRSTRCKQCANEILGRAMSKYLNIVWNNHKSSKSTNKNIMTGIMKDAKKSQLNIKRY